VRGGLAAGRRGALAGLPRRRRSRWAGRGRLLLPAVRWARVWRREVTAVTGLTGCLG